MFRNALFAVALSAALAPLSLLAATGPSSTQDPYLIPSAPGVEFTAILTVGDSVRKGFTVQERYRMAGVPDGLGAYDNADGTFTVLMNHELGVNPAGDPLGAVRDHGAAGAFISKWKIRKRDLKVLSGEDLIKKVFLWDGAGRQYVESKNNIFIRFCSADLAAPSAFFNPKTGKGFDDGRLFLNGEEGKSAGRPSQRAFAHIAEGRQQGATYQLPAFGKGSWENLLASPYPQDMTIVIADDDGGFNKVFIYIGQKQRLGSPIERAGLAGGRRYVLSIEGFTQEPPFDPSAPPFRGTFALVEDGDGSHGTTLLRPEDGAWDRAAPNRFYFTTTASADGNSRLWRLTFKDIARPELGGAIEVAVDGNAAPPPQMKMMDNLAVDREGNVYLLEDVGNHPRLGRIWSYQPSEGKVTPLGQHDPKRFDPSIPNNRSFLTQDEESSGIIDVTPFFKGVPGYDIRRNRYLLLDVQAHYPINKAEPHGFENPDELVEGGQLLLMTVPREKALADDRSEELE